MGDGHSDYAPGWAQRHGVMDGQLWPHISDIHRVDVDNYAQPGPCSVYYAALEAHNNFTLNSRQVSPMDIFPASNSHNYANKRRSTGWVI